MRLFLLICLLSSFDVLFAQTTAWNRVNPLPFGETVVEIQKITGTNRLVAACEYSSVLISDNGGETWQTIMYPANLPGDFHVNGMYFLNDRIGFLYGHSTILKTTDAGLTWKICNVPDPYGGISQRSDNDGFIDMKFTNDSTGFAINKSGYVLKTYNTGDDWHKKEFFLLMDYDFTSLDFSSSNVGFITCEAVMTFGYGLGKTYDYGETWSLESTVEGISTLIDNIHFITSLVGFASSFGKIYRTKDGGLHWQEVFHDTTRYSPFYFEFYNNLKGIAYYKESYYHPTAFFLTSDGGITWQPVNMPEEEVCCNDLAYFDENTLFSAGDNGCLFKSENGGLNWEKVSHKSITGDIIEVTMIDENIGIYVDWYYKKQNYSYVREVIKSDDGFNTLDTLPIQVLLDNVKIDFPDRDTGYVVSCHQGSQLLLIYRTTDGAQTWVTDSVTENNLFYNIDFYNGKNGLISFYRRLLLTSNGGGSWEEKTFSDDVSIRNACYVSARKIFISATDQSGPILLISEDSGETWSKISETVPRSGNLYFIDESSGFIISDTLYKTTDGGYSWTRCQINVPSFLINDISFPSPNVGYLVGRSDYHNVLKTTDGGLTWHPIHAPDVFPYWDVEFINNETGYIFSGNIIHKTTTGGVLGEERHLAGASKFHAYPNPFQSGIRIDFSGRSIQTPYQMNVFSMNGVKLYSTTIQPQASNIWFQGSMLSPGTYLLQFAKENQLIETIKVIKVE